MKTAALLTAQMHRNPHLIDWPHDAAGIRYESRPARRRARRRRRP